MKQAEFRKRLIEEFALRRGKNRRYSLRAYSLLIGTDHSTLSRILKGRRQVPAAQVMAWCNKLGIDEEEATAYVIAAAVPDPSDFARAEHLRHWSAEAMSILDDRTHWQTIELCASSGFRPDTRWIAKNAGVSVDDINVVLSRLLRLGLIEMSQNGEWRASKESARDEKAFRKVALRQVRSRAADLAVTTNGEKEK